MALPAKTYNDAQLDEQSRRVFMLALEEAEKMLKGEAAMNPEKLHALAATADAAACGFDEKDDDDDE